MCYSFPSVSVWWYIYIILYLTQGYGVAAGAGAGAPKGHTAKSNGNNLLKYIVNY